MATRALQKKQVVDLYRRCLREVPRTMNVFDMDMPEREVRQRVRALFDKQSDVTDPHVVNRLLLQGELDLQETIEVWKQKAQFYNLLGYNENSKPVLNERLGESPFLRKFYDSHN